MAEIPDSTSVEFLRLAGKMLLEQHEEAAVLELLNGVATCLSTMEQLSVQIVQAAFSPLPQALLTEKVLKLRETNVDINVVLATCLCEIMRITAPISLYNDDNLKVVFQVIVNSFEDLNEISNRWFEMRLQNLESISNIMLGLVMLDLKCDEQIDELFDIFLVTIREDHPAIVFCLMETIMSDIINALCDDEEISTYLIDSLLGSLQKNNREVGDISGILAEFVLKNCADKLRPYITEAIESSGASVDDYFEIVASVCEEETYSPMDTDDDSDE